MYSFHFISTDCQFLFYKITFKVLLAAFAAKKKIYINNQISAAIFEKPCQMEA